jgi:antitoxin component YwqK of YwqJK toxin-antitoxin module
MSHNNSLTSDFQINEKSLTNDTNDTNNFKIIDEKYPLHNEIFDDILKKYSEFISNDTYVYKLCVDVRVLNRGRVWLVIMQYTNETKTNELRDGVIDKFYAKFRGDKFLVVQIIDIEQPTNTKDKIMNRFLSPKSYEFIKTEYIVGKIVSADAYDRDINNVCSYGIHYFKSIKAAFCYGNAPLKNYTGSWYVWSEDGRVKLMYEYVNGKRHGLAIDHRLPLVDWTLNNSASAITSGDRKIESENYRKIDRIESQYINNQKVGIVTTYYDNSDIEQKIYTGEHVTFFPREKDDDKKIMYEKGEYKEGKKTNVWTINYPSGNLHMSGRYKDDNKIDKWTIYYDTNDKIIKACGEYYVNNRFGSWVMYHTNKKLKQFGTYDDCGRKHGEWIVMDKNYQIRFKITYHHGLRHGSYSEYFENGMLSSEGNYRHENKYGSWNIYDSNGELTEIIKYE